MLLGDCWARATYYCHCPSNWSRAIYGGLWVFSLIEAANSTAASSCCRDIITEAASELLNSTTVHVLCYIYLLLCCCPNLLDTALKVSDPDSTLNSHPQTEKRSWGQIAVADSAMLLQASLPDNRNKNDLL